MLTKTTYLAVACAVLLGASGCKKDDAAATGGGAEPAGSPASPAAPAKKAAPAFKWTAAPTLDAIPDGAIKGMANGVPFEVKSVVIQPSFGKWSIKLWDKELKRPTGIAMGGQSINLSLPPGQIAAGFKRVKALKYGDGYFQIRKDPKTDKTTSWNAKNAYAIEITKWDVKPHDPKGRIFQYAGRASGRIAVVYKGYGDFKDSYAAGTFTNAVVRYMGKPRWKKAETKTAGK